MLTHNINFCGIHVVDFEKIRDIFIIITEYAGLDVCITFSLMLPLMSL